MIRFKSGESGLFDTKTDRSDADAPNKNNAVLSYIQHENLASPGRILTGGIVIWEETAGMGSFRYCKDRIHDTNDLTGWEFFNPAKI